MLNKFTNKISRYFGLSNEFGVDLKQSEVKKRAIEFLKWESLGDLLPYRTYDSETGLFINQESIGFAFETGLYLGSDDRLENELGGLFKNLLPEGSSIQFLLSGTAKVDHIISNWENGSHGDEILKSLEKKRAKYFRKLAEDGKAKEFRGIVSVSVPVSENNAVVRKKILELKKQVIGTFSTRGGDSRSFDANELIGYLSDILNYDGSIKRRKGEWNEHEMLSKQIVDRDRQYSVAEDEIGIDENNYVMRTLSVSRYPSMWSFGAMSHLIGDSLNDHLKIPSAFFIHLGVYIESGKFKKAGMMAKASRVESQANSPLGKWIPALKREAQEWSFVREQLEKNERLIRSQYQVMIIDKPERIDKTEQLMISLYRSRGWEISRDKYIVLSSLLSMLPMTWGDGMSEDMSYYKKTRRSLSYEPINITPLQGEAKGSSTAGMLLTGRRGQLYYWYPFDKDLGNSNYNVAIVGQSGKGKSVFMEELAASIMRQKGRVYVIDVGRSFEKEVKNFGGQYIEFNAKSKICINPFTNIIPDETGDVKEELSLVKLVIAMMAAPKEGTTDYEDSIIEQGLMEVWQEKGRNADLQDIIDWLLKEGEKDDATKKLGKKLYSYGNDGTYGKYFNGKANINFNADFIVTELGELKGSIQDIAFLVMMLMVQQKVMQGDRSQETGIIIDEAADKLKGKHGADFIEGFIRRVRKNKGALIMGTQNLSDFYSSSGAEAALMNSDWLCCLSQKPEAIALLKKSDKFRISDGQQKLLESVDTKQGEYAEVMIMGSGQAMIGRLILDPYSLILYSTEPSEFNAVQKLCESGMSMEEAVTKVAKERYGSA